MKYSYDVYYQTGYYCGYHDAKKQCCDYESAMIANDIGQELYDDYENDVESAFYDGYSDAQDDYQEDLSL